MNIWLTRNLTPYGRNTVLKSLLLPKLNHLFSALPRPPDLVIDKFQKECFKFIWRNKPDKVKRDTIMLCPEHGGFKVPNIRKVISSQKLKWIQRLQLNESNIKKLLTHRLPCRNLLWISDKSYIQNTVIPSTSNPFWKEVFEDWSDTIDKYKKHVKTDHELLTQSIWNNENIQIGNKTVCYKTWVKQGITFF